MAPNNLEKQIKEKLNAREIKPSEMAWDRLDSMLTVAEAKSSKPFLWRNYFAIAATILLFIGIGLFVFNQKPTLPEPQNEVVIEEGFNTIQNDKNNQNNNSNQNDNEKNSEKINFEKEIEKNQVAESSNQQSKTIKSSIINQKTAVNSTIQNQKIAISIADNELATQNQKPIESIQIKPSNQKVININANDLLASVEKTIKKESKPGIKVNATTLLSQVDSELQQSYRETVISKIEKRFQNIKVAYSNRNQIQ